MQATVIPLQFPHFIELKLLFFRLELLLCKIACHLDVADVTTRAAVWDVCAFEEESLAQTVPRVKTKGAKILMAPWLVESQVSLHLPSKMNHIPPKS